MLIKICGVRDPKTALVAIRHGADLIGMIVTPGYRRSVSLEVAQQIAQAARDGGACPVAVFVSETPEQIAALCQTIGVDTVQSYGPCQTLAPHLKRIIVNAPDVPLREGDFLLLESDQPGSGLPVEEHKVLAARGKPFILAGGLNAGNVQERIQRYQPIGVDVSGGVEENGEKSSALIQEFIAKVRQP